LRPSPPLQLREAVCVLALCAADLAAAAAAGATAWFARDSLHRWLPLPDISLEAAVQGVALLYIALELGFLFRGMHLRREPCWETARLAATTILAALALTLAALFLARFDADVPRSFLVLSTAALLVSVPAARVAAISILARLGPWRRRTLLVACPDRAARIAADLESDGFLGYRIQAVASPFDPPETWRPLAALADETVVAADGVDRDALAIAVAEAQRTARSTTVIPNLAGAPFEGGATTSLLERGHVLLTSRNRLQDPLNLAVKRAFDFVFALLGLALSAPLLLVVALAVKLESPGPILFRQERIGRQGRRFRMLKFRTMRADAERSLQEILESDPLRLAEWERAQKLRDDPRVTRLGRLLRVSSLDELPQLWNVIAGSMSLVGPRPLPAYHYEKFVEPFRTDYLHVKPGITGLWQVSGRGDSDLEAMAHLNAWYARNWSLWLDLTILLRTVPAVLRGRGAY
jgi:Undecaprenyl-phosphate galactose phosphotransferase WbaP